MNAMGCNQAIIQQPDLIKKLCRCLAISVTDVMLNGADLAHRSLNGRKAMAIESPRWSA